MSRVYEDDSDESFPNQWHLQQHNMKQVLVSQRGRNALADLRTALQALPEPRLIGRALSTAGKAVPGDALKTATDHDRQELLGTEGEGVCAVGAYVWWQHVLAGADPVQAMRDLPLNPDYDGGSWETVNLGKEAGLAATLAWVLLCKNDDTFKELTPEVRFTSFMAWIEQTLAASVTA